LGQRDIFTSAGVRVRSFDPHEPQVTTIMPSGVDILENSSAKPISRLTARAF